MAVAFRSAQNTTYASRTSSVTVNAPASVADDDIILLFGFTFGTTPGTTLTPPAGFALVPINSATAARLSTAGGVSSFTDGANPLTKVSGGNTEFFDCWWKRAASEGASYVVTFSGTVNCQLMVAAYSGGETSGLPFAGTAALQVSFGSQVMATPRASAATWSNTLAVFANADLAATAVGITPPSGYTERVDVAPLIYLADAAFTGPGTVTLQSTAGNSPDNFAFELLLLPPRGTLTGVYARSISGIEYISRAGTLSLNAPIDLQDNDILLLIALTGASGTAPTMTPPSGFTAITLGSGANPTTVTGGGFNVKMWAWWKRAASEGTSYTVTWTGTNGSTATMLAIRGAKVSGTPTDVANSNSGTGTTATGSALTTTVANTLLCYVMHDFGDTTSDLTAPSGMSEAFDSAPLIYMATQAIAATGSTSTRTQTNNTTGGNPWATYMIAFQPEPAAAAGVVFGSARMTAGYQRIYRPVPM